MGAETAERNLGGIKNLTERNVDSEYYPKHFTELSGQSKDGVGYQQNPQQLLVQQSRQNSPYALSRGDGSARQVTRGPGTGPEHNGRSSPEPPGRTVLYRTLCPFLQ